jgi:AraC-like DNA-binding protein
MAQLVVGDPTFLWSRSDFPISALTGVGERSRRADHFSTFGLREPERIEMWEEHNARALVGLSARTLNGSPLEATELNLQLGDLRIAHVTASAHVVERNVHEIARTPGDGAALYFTLFGESFFYDEDGVYLQRPGGLLLCDINRPFMRGFANGLQEFVLTVPGELYESIAERSVPRRPVMRSFSRIPGANAHAARLARLVQMSLSSDDVDVVQVEAGALELLRMIISADSAEATSYRSHAILYIDRHLGDPTMSVGTVANGVGLSERHLGRIFADTGTGVARVILERRLDAARRLLVSSAAGSVGEIATRCGFASQSHFSRVFRDASRKLLGAIAQGRLATANRAHQPVGFGPFGSDLLQVIGAPYS